MKATRFTIAMQNKEDSMTFSIFERLGREGARKKPYLVEDEGNSHPDLMDLDMDWGHHRDD